MNLEFFDNQGISIRRHLCAHEVDGEPWKILCTVGQNI